MQEEQNFSQQNIPAKHNDTPGPFPTPSEGMPASSPVDMAGETRLGEEAPRAPFGEAAVVLPRDGSSKFPYIEERFGAGRKKVLVIVFAVFLLAGLGGGGAFGYVYYFESPERTVPRMFERMAKVKTLEYSSSFVLNASDANEALAQINVSSRGSSDWRVPEKIKAAGNLDVNANVFSQGNAARVTIVSGAEFKTVDSIFYLKLTRVPGAEIFDLSFIKDQWIAIDPEELKQEFQTQELQNELQSGGKFSPTKQEQIRDAILSSKLWEITEKLSGGKIEGQDTQHYAFVMSKEELKRLMVEIYGIMEEEQPDASALKDLDDALGNIEELSGEMWIGKWDSLLYKLVATAQIKDPNNRNAKGELTFTLELKNFDKEVAVEAPQSFKSLKEAMEEFMSRSLQSGGGSMFPLIPSVPSTPYPLEPPVSFAPNEEENVADIDADGLPDSWEALYGADLTNPDTDGDGFLDGEEVNSGYNPAGPGRLL